MELGFSVAKAGRYRLRVLATAAPDFGIVRAALNGKSLGPAMDLYSGRICPAGSLELGTLEMPVGPHRLRVKAVGEIRLAGVRLRVGRGGPVSAGEVRRAARPELALCMGRAPAYRPLDSLVALHGVAEPGEALWLPPKDFEMGLPRYLPKGIRGVVVIFSSSGWVRVFG